MFIYSTIFSILFWSTYVSCAKYFYEAGNIYELIHYDDRFFHYCLYPSERQETLRDIVRAWLVWTESEGIESWLAHGSLIGWYWAGQNLPWDNDADVQVTLPTLDTLATHNMTTVTIDLSALPLYKGPNDLPPSQSGPVEFVIDINPNYVVRKDDRANLIDARWIHKASGMYIDITGVAEINPETEPDIVSCKNNHHYSLDDIFPLKRTIHEGVKAWIPYNYERILIKEYGIQSLKLTNFKQYIRHHALADY
ncbi:Protein MNN4 [Neolecta irregularis DAH-3]|uniref:Protein MNN4 n=1 Tax=Neolecta irregularis (strain DAH-3) TaxID=1198029 RepID=A0A1U7LQ86_NEOID|nr:Protein MNN4 [Neolecta irregularis DAH-3]|eukprot:OLL24825.1 Protein MNN4 [Neolecta irregularis DAH-3]